MRYKIWEKDDFFKFMGNDTIIDMDPIVVQLRQEPVAVVPNFNYEKPPLGWASDIRIEDGDLTCVIEWTEESGLAKNQDLVDEGGAWRLGGYYTEVVREEVSEGREIVTSCVLKAISLVLQSAMPKVKL